MQHADAIVCLVVGLIALLEFGLLMSQRDRVRLAEDQAAFEKDWREKAVKHADDLHAQYQAALDEHALQRDTLERKNTTLRRKVQEQRKHIAGIERVRRVEIAEYVDMHQRMSKAQAMMAAAKMDADAVRVELAAFKRADTGAE